MNIPNRPNGKFDPESELWQQWVFMQASELDIGVRDIAGMACVPLNTFTSYRNIAGVHAAGRAVFRMKVAEKMASIMFVDTFLIEDENDRRQAQALQADMIKHFTKLELKREEMHSLKDEKAMDREIISKLTTEELKTRARELLK